MTPALITALASGWLHLPHLPRLPLFHPAPEASSWQLRKVTDRFTGEVTCTLSRDQGSFTGRGATVSPRAVTLRLPSTVETANAVYRVDGGPVIRWQDLYPALSSQRLPVDTGDLLHPSRGRLALPLASVSDATVIAVRTHRRARPVTFVVAGFSDALAEAKASGCRDADIAD